MRQKAEDDGFIKPLEFSLTNILITWCPHTDDVSKKIAVGLAVLTRIATIVPFETRVNIYNALAISFFNYCSPIWG